MNKLIFRAAAAVASLLCLLLTSCNHRELCYDHEHWIDLQVAFDWSEEPAAAPATMVVWFFPADAETEGARVPTNSEETEAERYAYLPVNTAPYASTEAPRHFSSAARHSTTCISPLKARACSNRCTAPWQTHRVQNPAKTRM